MGRRHLTFACMGARLAGTLDEAPGTTGLLIVSGGNETRAGAFSGQAQLAARIATEGFPVFRFDRRGVGDSKGGNSGFRGSAPDIAAALALFRAETPQMERVVAFGNCDAASGLMLQAGAGMDALVLANPWTVEDDSSAPPPDALRQRYAAKLRNPGEWLRLLTGKVSLGKLAGGLRRAAGSAPGPSSLAQEMAAGLARFAGPATILLAGRDRTAQIFESGWDKSDQRIARCPDATHAFAEPHARDWLFERLVETLKSQA
jgi:exosortase A-associated hydrolase 1